MNRTRNTKINVFFGVISKVFSMILEFFSRALFIHYLGEELLGVNGVFTNVIQMLSLAELGMNNVVMFSFYKPLAEKQFDKISALITYYRKIYNSIAFIVFILGLLIMPFIDLFINIDIKIKNIQFIFFLFLIDTVCSYLFVYKVILLRADQKSFIISKYEMFFNIIRVMLQCLSLVILHSFVIYLLIKIIMSIVYNFSLSIKTNRSYPYIKKRKELDIIEKKYNLEMVKSGFIYKLSAVLLNSTDNVLISSIVGTVWVGLLSNYNIIRSALSAFVVIIFSSVTASVGNLVNLESNNKKIETFNILLCIGFWIAIVSSTCMWYLCDDFINLWIGKRYIVDKQILSMIIGMNFLSCTMHPIFTFREALGLYTKTKYAMLLAAIINIMLSIILGNILGVFGILLASIIAILLTYFWYEPFVLYNDYFGINSRIYFFNYIKNLLYAILGFIMLYLINDLIEVHSWLSWTLKGFIIFSVINIYCLIIYHNTSEFKILKNKFFRNSNFRIDM